MLRLKLIEYAHQAGAPAIQQLIDTLLATQESANSYAANSLFLDRVGLRLEGTRDEDYYREVLHYHLALLYAYAGEPERAAAHMAQSHLPPASSADQLFSEHVHDARELRTRQEIARQRGMPPLLIASMPRSASVTLTQTLSKHMDMPVLRLSLARILLVPTWLKAFAAGGALTHDHFEASAFNLTAIGDSGIRDVFVLVRDPRAAAASMRNLVAANTTRRSTEQTPSDDYEAGVLTLFERHFAPWLQGWLACTSQPPPGLRVHWILSTNVRSRLAIVVRGILQKLQPDYPALASYADAPVTTVVGNFVQGDDDAWRNRISGAGRQRMWDLMPPDAVTFLGLER